MLEIPIIKLEELVVHALPVFQFHVSSRDFPLKNTVSCPPSTSEQERTRCTVKVNGGKGPMAHHSPDIAYHFGRKSFIAASTISSGEDRDG